MLGGPLDLFIDFWYKFCYTIHRLSGIDNKDMRP